jgi:hypothetical protein
VLAVPDEAALAIRDDVGFFQAVRSVLAKSTSSDRRTDEELDHAIREIVARAVASDEVIDIFAAAGLKRSDISIFSDESLAEVRGDASAEPRRGAAAGNCSRARSSRARAETSSRDAPSPTCWSSPSAATRTGQSSPRRSSRS